MKISQLVKVLLESLESYGDLEIMIEDRDCNQLPVSETDIHVTEDGEFPEDWNMPAGFTFLKIVAG